MPNPLDIRSMLSGAFGAGRKRRKSAKNPDFAAAATRLMPTDVMSGVSSNTETPR